MRNLVIAIDGPSASGKGTLAKKIAQHFNLPYLNSGALYRAVAFALWEQKIDLDNFMEFVPRIVRNLREKDLERQELLTEEIGYKASIIAKEPKLRAALISWQQDFAKNSKESHGGCVIDGRDITTTICPEADYKFFIKADVEARAQRRYKQLKEKDNNISYEEILEKLRQRDHNDINRKESPLKIAPDATIIDNSLLNANETLQEALLIIESVNEKEQSTTKKDSLS